MRYTFGTDKIAAARLEEIAKFFNPLSAQFIRDNLNETKKTAVDMGCGPGFTTDMLARATDCKEIFGLDNSDSAIAIAKNNFPHLNFIKHDVTKPPFPLNADIMYTRFVLSHLADVDELLALWTNELNKGGMLFIEELEDIFTETPVFQRYLEINTALVRSQGADLFVGKTLRDKAFANIALNESFIVPVNDRQAATWFYPNTVSIWEKEECVLDLVSPDERQEISKALLDIKSNRNDKSNISWQMRRLIVKKTV